MGKVQSKQGECYVFNAHLNPACQLDEEARKRQKMPMTSPSNQFCSELSLSLCDLEDKTSSDKRSLKVYLPPKDSCKQIEIEDIKPEKAEEEKSEKEEKKNSSLKSDNAEFSFTLYDFNGRGQITKDDVKRVVGRTISEALEKSLNLSSSNHTIQVHLAISPENSSKNKPPKDQTTKEESKTVNDKISCKSHNVNNNLSSTVTSEKLNRKKYYDQLEKKSPNLNISSHQRHLCTPHRSHQKCSLTDDGSPLYLNEKISVEQNCKNRHHLLNHQNLPEGFTHHSRYLDLAGIENYTSEFATRTTTSCAPLCEYPREILERTNVDMRNHKESKHSRRRKHHNRSTHLSNVNASPQMFQHYKERRCDHLNRNFELNDCILEDKFDCERHKRTKSFDIHKNTEYLQQHGSPKTRCHDSPNHHHCQKYKERQWDKLTKLIDFSIKNQRENSKPTSLQGKDQWDHHHVHEHVHHHYHYYVDSNQN